MRRYILLAAALAVGGFLAKNRAAKAARGLGRAAAQSVRARVPQEGPDRGHTIADWFGTAARERYGEESDAEPERKE